MFLCISYSQTLTNFEPTQSEIEDHTVLVCEGGGGPGNEALLGLYNHFIKWSINSVQGGEPGNVVPLHGNLIK